MGLTSLQMKMELRTPPCRTPGREAEAASGCSPTSETRTAMRRRRRTRMKRPCDSRYLRAASPPRFDQCPLAADTGTAAVSTHRGRGAPQATPFQILRITRMDSVFCLFVLSFVFCLCQSSLLWHPPGTTQKRLCNKTIYATSPT